MDEREPTNCGSCVHQYQGEFCSHSALGAGRGDRVHCDAAPHDCEHWEASDRHRIALALEGVEVAMAAQAGLFDVHQEPEVWECTCGVTLTGPGRDEDVSCPNCDSTWSFISTGASGWARTCDA